MPTSKTSRHSKLLFLFMYPSCNTNTRTNHSFVVKNLDSRADPHHVATRFFDASRVSRWPRGNAKQFDHHKVNDPNGNFLPWHTLALANQETDRLIGQLTYSRHGTWNFKSEILVSGSENSYWGFKQYVAINQLYARRLILPTHHCPPIGPYQLELLKLQLVGWQAQSNEIQPMVSE